jgi:hypothetical protein
MPSAFSLSFVLSLRGFPLPPLDDERRVGDDDLDWEGVDAMEGDGEGAGVRTEMRSSSSDSSDRLARVSGAVSVERDCCSAVERRRASCRRTDGAMAAME